QPPRRNNSQPQRMFLHYIWMARPARLEYLAVLEGGTIDEARDDELDVCLRHRATDGGRFDDILAGRAGLALESMPEWAQHAIARCQRYATVFATSPESRARSLVQAAESLLACWAREGDVAWALDCLTSTWRGPDELVERPFSVERHFIVVVEAV